MKICHTALIHCIGCQLATLEAHGFHRGSQVIKKEIADHVRGKNNPTATRIVLEKEATK